MVIICILYLVLFIIIGLFAVVCLRVKSAGMNVSDFFKFIFAINDFEHLYTYAKTNKDMTKKEEQAFVKSAEKMFSAFDKIPSIIWEEEYEKYSEVLEKYKDIRVLRWAKANG